MLDLKGTARLDEWPSDEASGIRFSLEAFDEDTARKLLADRPEVRDAKLSLADAVAELQEQLLLDLRICWWIVPVQAEAALAIQIPSTFTPDAS